MVSVLNLVSVLWDMKCDTDSYIGSKWRGRERGISLPGESCWESNMTRMPWINSEFETGDTIGIRFLLSSQGLCSLPQLFSALFFDKVEKYQSPLLLVIYLVLD